MLRRAGAIRSGPTLRSVLVAVALHGLLLLVLWTGDPAPLAVIETPAFELQMTEEPAAPPVAEMPAMEPAAIEPPVMEPSPAPELAAPSQLPAPPGPPPPEPPATPLPAPLPSPQLPLPRKVPVKPAVAARPSPRAGAAPPAALPRGPPAASEPPPTQAPAAADAGAESAWRSALAGWIERHRIYPDEARRRGDQGVVLLRVVLDEAGRVREVALARGSGVTVLDDAALAMMRGAVLPTPPGAAGRGVTLSLRYRLE